MCDTHTRSKFTVELTVALTWITPEIWTLVRRRGEFLSEQILNEIGWKQKSSHTGIHSNSCTIVMWQAVDNFGKCCSHLCWFVSKLASYSKQKLHRRIVESMWMPFWRFKKRWWWHFSVHWWKKWGERESESQDKCWYHRVVHIWTLRKQQQQQVVIALARRLAHINSKMAKPN